MAAGKLHLFAFLSKAEVNCIWRIGVMEYWNSEKKVNLAWQL
jgi:hypothetical protein